MKQDERRTGSRWRRAVAAVAVGAVVVGALAVGAWWATPAASWRSLATAAEAHAQAGVARWALRQAAERGDAVAQFEMASRTMVTATADGGYVPNPEGPRWVARAQPSLEALAPTDTTAATLLGHLRMSEFYGVRDTTAALHWWRTAAAHGSRDARFNLALYAYRAGRFPEALPALTDLAEAGYPPEAAELLALHALQQAADTTAARHWLHRAAALGSASAAQALHELQ